MSKKVEKLTCPDRLLPRIKPKSNVFNGEVKLRDNCAPILPREMPIKRVWDFDIPLPYVPQHIFVALGEETVCNLWQECLDYDADESEMISARYLPRICKNMIEIHNSSAPFDKIKLPSKQKDEFIEFREIIKLVSDIMNKPGYEVSSGVKTNTVPVLPRIAHPNCCMCDACKPQNTITIKNNRTAYERSPATAAGEHIVNVVFNRLKVERNGVLRFRDIPQLLTETKIPFDLSRIPASFLHLHGAAILESAVELDEFIERVRTDVVIQENELDNLYAVPAWLKEEFTASEIMLFTHQFMNIDLDHSGSVEAAELVALTESMGGKITMVEAQALVDTYDTDRSGTIDFREFLMLMFKIKNGTINLEDNILAKAMIEARAQLAVFEEIEGVQRDPPPHCRLDHYGGSPLSCVVMITGLAGSCYEGAQFEVQVVFFDGYPYRLPGTVIHYTI